MRISLNKAASLLNSGHVVAVPTETVYGLAASLKFPLAIDSIFSLKGRPANNPLIIHLSDQDQLLEFVSDFPPKFYEIIHTFWPGPLTIVLPIAEDKIPSRIRAGLSTAAFRFPQHKLANALMQMTGPLVMPSANLSGKPSATKPEHVEEDFGSHFPILDGGSCVCGLESTIIIYSDNIWKIIRQGALPPEAFTHCLGYTPPIEKPSIGQKPLCPGQLYRHYAPKAALKLTKVFSDDMRGVVLGFEDKSYPPNLEVIYLGHSQDPNQIAEALYRTFREVDEKKIPEVWVDIRFPDDGLWRTILERIQKASNH